MRTPCPPSPAVVAAPEALGGVGPGGGQRAAGSGAAVTRRLIWFLVFPRLARWALSLVAWTGLVITAIAVAPVDTVTVTAVMIAWGRGWPPAKLRRAAACSLSRMSWRAVMVQVCARARSSWPSRLRFGVSTGGVKRCTGASGALGWAPRASMWQQSTAALRVAKSRVRGIILPVSSRRRAFIVLCWTRQFLWLRVRPLVDAVAASSLDGGGYGLLLRPMSMSNWRYCASLRQTRPLMRSRLPSFFGATRRIAS